MILIGVHVLAVIKHMIIDKENILKRMLFTKNKGTVK
jgi:cytochrome b561